MPMASLFSYTKDGLVFFPQQRLFMLKNLLPKRTSKSKKQLRASRFASELKFKLHVPC